MFFFFHKGHFLYQKFLSSFKRSVDRGEESQMIEKYCYLSVFFIVTLPHRRKVFAHVCKLVMDWKVVIGLGFHLNNDHCLI